MGELIVAAKEGEVFLPGDPYEDKTIVDAEPTEDGKWRLIFEEIVADNPDLDVETEIVNADAHVCEECAKKAAPPPPPTDNTQTPPAGDQLKNEPAPDTPLTWADVPQIIDMAVNAIQQMAEAQTAAAELDSLLATLPIFTADAMLYTRVPKTGFEYNEIVTWSGGEALAGEMLSGPNGEKMLTIIPIIEGRRDSCNQVVVPIGDVQSTGMVAQWDWQDDEAIILPGEGPVTTPPPAQNPPAVPQVPAQGA